VIFVLSVVKYFAGSPVFPIFPGIPEIRGQILKTPMVIKPSNQSKPALSLTQRACYGFVTANVTG
jgi:hypothetical protein